MTNWRQKIQHQDLSKTGKPWATIEQPISIETREGVESVIDTFNFKIADKCIPEGTEFGDQDNIHIAFGSTTTPTHVDFDGLITDLTLTEEIGGKIWTVKGNNRFEYIMGYQRPTAMTWTTACSACSTLLSQVNDANTANPDWVNLVWNPNNTVTSFSFNFYRPYKPVYQHVEELTTNEYTGAGNFIYYLEGGSTFTWKEKPNTLTGSIVEGHDFFSNKAQKTSFDVVNAAIIHGGDDFNGNPIFRYVVNLQSVGKLGFKWKYFEDWKLSEEIKAQAGASPNTASSFGVASNYTGGNAAFRNDVASQIKKKWQPIVFRLGMPRYRADIEMRGTTGHVLGDLYEIQSPTLGWDDGYNLRLRERMQTFQRNGWVTRLHFEEDEEAAVENI